MRTFTAWQLIWAILRRPHYKILLCAETVMPPSPWADTFKVEIDDQWKVIRLTGHLT